MAGTSYNTAFIHAAGYRPWSARGNSRKWNQADNPALAKGLKQNKRPKRELVKLEMNEARFSIVC
jgi:hypothetical protein